MKTVDAVAVFLTIIELVLAYETGQIAGMLCGLGAGMFIGYRNTKL